MTDHEPRLWRNDDAIRRVGEGFLACTLSKAEWTHEAHISTTCWLIWSGGHPPTGPPGPHPPLNESVAA